MAWQYLATLEQAAPQARYRLQFNNTDETGYKLKTVMGLTEQGRRIEATLSNLESRIKTLYRIIIDIDETNEKHIAPQKYKGLVMTQLPAPFILLVKRFSFQKNAKYPPEICKLKFSDLKKDNWKLSDFYHL